MFNYETNTVGFAISANAPEGTSITRVKPTGGDDGNSGNGSDGGGLSGAAIAFIVIGVVVLIGVLVPAVYCCLKRAR